MSKINHASVISNTVIEKKIEDIHENQDFNNPEIKSETVAEITKHFENCHRIQYDLKQRLNEENLKIDKKINYNSIIGESIYGADTFINGLVYHLPDVKTKSVENTKSMSFKEETIISNEEFNFVEKLIEVFNKLKNFISKLKINAEKELREKEIYFKNTENLEKHKNKYTKLKLIFEKIKKSKNI